ncbi:MAG: hypothetical protein DCF24_11135 [Cyanobium sp.]|nr:nucleotidyltransferase domain-containing protein [Synechococcus sp. CS-1326]MCT0234212.1 nucleotidyltransferase domain-containing protein [Synechococcus sp. CS-1327]PZU98183.1 MAG: hypothetical protein DCF24_11135 [Cyanobium sp.]
MLPPAQGNTAATGVLTQPVPGLPPDASARLLAVLAACPAVESTWLYGSRAMGRHQPASDVDLTLQGAHLSHRDLLQLMEAIDDLLLPWQVDLSLHADLHDDLRDHVERVGLPVLTRMERKD